MGGEHLPQKRRRGHAAGGEEFLAPAGLLLFLRQVGVCSENSVSNRRSMPHAVVDLLIVLVFPVLRQGTAGGEVELVRGEDKARA